MAEKLHQLQVIYKNKWILYLMKNASVRKKLYFSIEKTPLWIDNKPYRLGGGVAKGQLISKCLFGVLNSSKKRTKTIRPEVS